MDNKKIEEIKQNGFIVLRNLINKEWLDILLNSVDNVFLEHRKIQLHNNNEITSDGIALHAILSDEIFLKFLDYFLTLDLVKNLSESFFESNCILNSFSVLNNLPNKPNFSSQVHRDLRFYSYPLPVMVNLLIMLDDFTNENGGTLVLPQSHLSKTKPSDDFFYKNCHQITGKSGDILIFDSNVWHASAPNKTNDSRRAIPITISRSFLKQLLDYPRALGHDKMNSFSNDLQQFLGYHSRVPSSLSEWYLPEKDRFYKKNQD
jgi:ectoine hydroxylase-related dioxygenase (phytanoyl-CoA dioxygenase family)